MNSIKSQELNWKEKMASIDRQLAEHDKLRIEIKYEPWKLAIGGFATGVGTVALLLTLAKIAGIII